WVQTGYLKFSAKGTKREVFEMPIPGSLITADLREASYYQEYLANVVKYRWFCSLWHCMYDTVMQDLGIPIQESSSFKPQKTQKHRKPKRKNTQVPQPSGSTEHVADEAVYKDLDDRLVRVATTASSLEVEQNSGNIDKIQSKATPNEASYSETTSGGGHRGNILRSDKDSMKLNELMELYTNLQSMVLALEKTKTTQALEITSLKRRVKKLEKKQRLRTHKRKRLYKVGLIARLDSYEDEQNLGEDASKQGKIEAINADEDITLVNDQDDAKLFDVTNLHGEEVFVAEEDVDKEVNDEIQKVVEEVVEDINTAKLIIDVAQVNVASEVNAANIATTNSAAATITINEVTLGKALIELKASKPKVKEDKGKGIMVEELVKPKNKEKIRPDEEAALKLQDEFEEEHKLAREKA
nr:hypothetical protein [Tanacetum cinerariifolium]